MWQLSVWYVDVDGKICFVVIHCVFVALVSVFLWREGGGVSCVFSSSKHPRVLLCKSWWEFRAAAIPCVFHAQVPWPSRQLHSVFHGTNLWNGTMNRGLRILSSNSTCNCWWELWLKPPNGGLGFLMSPPCLESQGCQFYPTFLYLILFFCQVLSLFLSYLFLLWPILLTPFSLNLHFLKGRLLWLLSFLCVSS